MAKTKTSDWIKQAKVEYISSKDVSLKDIAKRYKKGYPWVRQVASRDNWIKEKEKRWADAEKEALEDVEGSIKDLIKRHAKVARYLQAAGLKNLKLLLDEVEEKIAEKDPEAARKLLKSLIYNKIISAGTLTSIVSEGLKAERELYPKQMKIEGDVEMKFGEVSDELLEAAHNALIKRITSKPRENTKRN
jgi:hypothetical protein